jgi:peroxiredoxin
MKGHMRNQLDVDWSAIPVPVDDGAAAHLTGSRMPSLPLRASDGSCIDLSSLTGLTVVYVYPRTGRPDRPVLDGWDMIPGARGCTPQSCAFRDHFSELRQAGAEHVFGLSSQDTDYQREAAERLHLPFVLLSDAQFRLAELLQLPQFEASGMRLLKRLTMIIRDGIVAKVHYPVFPPDRDVDNVLAWLRSQGAGADT